MSSVIPEVSDFSLVGQLLGFIIKDSYKIKYLRIAFADREYRVKPAKEIREQILETIVPGSWVEVRGMKKQSRKTGKVKLKANSVKPVKSNNTTSIPVSVSESPPLSKASILVCQKSSCWKRGGRAICQVLEESLRDRGLADKVQIKLTGCLKQCKQGPNLVMMPGKARYCQVRPERIPELLQEHFASSYSEVKA
ncbi:NADH:ubiquinone oxidoreductase 24 kD subunit [Pleurocapsa sp. PCC 7327]|uniref:(2Fe-2S) ferredoxin domain-containing protein n=1 Tax=Pleurocapsa sp. PCC 7327 TaxID=118163 RepID=UPI00029FFFE1|nr:(2Fe-2S) ferredoxin domain-containing protein [Pleurocapsa sp. PCC 7327]AFY77709.1 NADH:ubiquinone oxidoreductase 24 kD subunit [Pleurocapsa sp. PCC 7327]